MIIQRDIYPTLKTYLEDPKILILRGARQVGKTTLMKQLQEDLGERMSIYVFCDEVDFESRVKSKEDLFYWLEQKHGYKRGNELVLLLDEFQVIEQSGKLLKNIYDMHPEIKLICSGSSSLEITQNVEFLTGRKHLVDILPFSFREYLLVHKPEISQNNFALEQREELHRFYNFWKEDLEHLFHNYLLWGGYPEVVLVGGGNIEEKREKLNEIVNTYLKKDVSAFLKIKNIGAYNQLIRVLSSQVGDMVNKSELASTLGISINTLNHYLDVLEGTFVIDFARPFFTNVRKELSKMPKVYFQDSGLRNIVLYSGAPTLDEGALVENYVHQVLKNRFKEVNFYRTISQKEIDFIIREKGSIRPIEVKYRKKVPTPAFFKNFQERYPDSKTPIIFSRSELDIKDIGVFVPACIAEFVEW